MTDQKQNESLDSYRIRKLYESKHSAETLKAQRHCAELEKIKFDIGQYLLAYAPDFFNEPEGFKPKLDMNSAALVRHVLTQILNPKA